MKANNELIVDIYNNFIKERKIEKSSNSEFKTYISKLIQNNLSDFFSVTNNPEEWEMFLKSEGLSYMSEN